MDISWLGLVEDRSWGCVLVLGDIQSPDTSAGSKVEDLLRVDDGGFMELSF